jgi:SAM-dependent methyltransferase
MKASGENFFDAWAIYQEVLDRNYMFHDEIYEGVGQFFAGRYGNRPFSLLDLGCGSARHLAKALGGRSVKAYAGYDLSAQALAHARINLAVLGCPVELCQGDLLEGLRASEDSIDLIFCSFALHHLSSTDKSSFFQSACRRLNEHGMLLVIDTMRAEDENLPVYLDRYCAWVRATWRALSPQELGALCDHVRNNDLPETPSTLCSMAVDGGFAQGIELDHFGWHHTFFFEKKAALHDIARPV